MSNSTNQSEQILSEVEDLEDADGIDDIDMGEAAVEGMRTGPTTETILVEGDIDVSSASLLRERITAAFVDTIDEIIVDLRDCTFIDSTGLGVLVSARTTARASGTEFKLVLPDGPARFPFEVTGLASVFTSSE